MTNGIGMTLSPVNSMAADPFRLRSPDPNTLDMTALSRPN
jgi:hypothetical protein